MTETNRFTALYCFPDAIDPEPLQPINTTEISDLISQMDQALLNDSDINWDSSVMQEVMQAVNNNCNSPVLDICFFDAFKKCRMEMETQKGPRLDLPAPDPSTYIPVGNDQHEASSRLEQNNAFKQYPLKFRGKTAQVGVRIHIRLKKNGASTNVR